MRTAIVLNFILAIAVLISGASSVVLLLNKDEYVQPLVDAGLKLLIAEDWYSFLLGWPAIILSVSTWVFLAFKQLTTSSLKQKFIINCLCALVFALIYLVFNIGLFSPLLFGQAESI